MDGRREGGKEGRREGGRRDGKKEGRPTVHRMILVIHDEVRIKKQINNMNNNMEVVFVHRR